MSVMGRGPKVLASEDRGRRRTATQDRRGSRCFVDGECGRALASPLASIAVFLALAGTAGATGIADVEGADALQKVAAAKGGVRIIARLTPPVGTKHFTGAALAAAQHKLAATMQASGSDQRPSARALPVRGHDRRRVAAAQAPGQQRPGRGRGRGPDRSAHSLMESVPLIQRPGGPGGRGHRRRLGRRDPRHRRRGSSHPFLGRPRRGRGVLLGRRRLERRHHASAPTGNPSRSVPGRPDLAPSGCEHGTHVAGIAAGRNDQMTGVAPAASIIAVQVFTDFGSGNVGAFFCDILRGLDQVARPFAAAAMKIAGRRTSASAVSLLRRLLRRRYASGAYEVRHGPAPRCRDRDRHRVRQRRLGWLP